MLKIWALLVKGLQSCRLSNFENDSTAPGFEPGPNGIAHALAGMAEAADFFLRTPTLTTSNFAALWPADLKFSALKDLNLYSKRIKFHSTAHCSKGGAKVKINVFKFWLNMHIAVPNEGLHWKRSKIEVCIALNLCFGKIHFWVLLVKFDPSSDTQLF